MAVKRDVREPFVEELRLSVAELLTPKAMRVLFYVACALWLAHQVLYGSFLYTFVLETPLSEENVAYYVTLLTLLCEVGAVCNGGYTGRDAYALVALVVMCVGPLSRTYILYLAPYLLVFCARSFDVRKTVAFCAVVVALTVLVVMLCAGMGVVSDVVMDEGTRVRHCLGFLFFLSPSMYAFMLTCAACYLRGRDLSFVEGALLLVANVLMYLLTDSETSFGLSMAVVACTLALKVRAPGRLSLGWLWKALSWSWVLAFAASVVLTVLYGLLHGTGVDVLERLNAATRGRFSYGWSGLNEFGVTALGQYVPWQGNGLGLSGYNPHIAAYNYVDNMFIHLLLEQGWVYVAGLVGLCTGVTRRAYATGDKAALLALAALAAYAILNDLTMHLHYNLLLLLIAELYVPAARRRDGGDGAAVGQLDA